MEFERLKKENKPVIAICYDFDKTLTPIEMQAQGFIQKVYGNDSKQFWEESNELAVKNSMDQMLAYMYKMKIESEGKEIFTHNKLKEYGSKIELYPGVIDWFDRINNYANDKGIIIEHYVISSGIFEIIEGTELYNKNVFKAVYASKYLYDVKDVAIWPAQMINFTNKTQFLFRISKGTIDVNDQGVNDYFDKENIRIPFDNFIYIGDSDTDIPCMKIVNEKSGYSIGVYDENGTTDNKNKVYKMFNEKRIKFFAPANYTQNSTMEKLAFSIIDSIVSRCKVENYYYECNNDTKEYYNNNCQTKDDILRYEIIDKLSNSTSFTNTHVIIKELNQHFKYNQMMVEKLCKIAMENSQVRWILSDSDVSLFYFNILKDINVENQNINDVKELINK